MQFYKINDLIYACACKSNRSGFVHCVQVLNKYGEKLTESKTQYYNRTWESYTFQSAMRQAQAKLRKVLKQCEQGKKWLNYQWENWAEYNFDNQPPLATWAD